jgi:hypothetical protein
MKPIGYIRKYKLDKTKRFDHNKFIADLTLDFLTLLEVGKGNENIKGFENAIRAIRMKWDGIDNKTRALPEKLWKYFYATVVAKMREEIFPEEMKQRKEKKERWKKYKEQEKAWRREEERMFFDSYIDLFAHLFGNVPLPVDDFSTLGLTDGATADEVKQAYRKLAMKHHPDKGGNQATFVKITEAKNKCLAFLSS